MDSTRNILLNPGPVTLTDAVRQSLLSPDQCHREPEFANLVIDIISRTKKIYPKSSGSFTPVLVTGSGTCAVEAMMNTFAPDNSKTLVICNGVYGERICAMLEVSKRPLIAIKNDWTEAINLQEIETALNDNSDISHVTIVHNETTTGRLNHLDELLILCEKYDKQLLVDAVSSFGAEEIDFSHPRLQAVAATGNKCLHGIVGIALVMVKTEAFSTQKSFATSLYLNLFSYFEAQKTGYSPFTPAVHACFALQQALIELEKQGGQIGRLKRYHQLSQRIRLALNSIGINSLVSNEALSSMISSFMLPQNWDYNRLHDLLRAEGYIIYAGQGALFHKMFRICNMGDLQDEDIDRLITIFKKNFSKT